MRRRTLLKASVPLGMGVLLTPLGVSGAYPEEAFKATELADVLRQAVGTADIGDSDQIRILAPDIVNDSSLVPVRIETTLDDIESISLVASANGIPLTAHYRLFEARNFITTRIRMDKAGELLAVVKAAGALHTARLEVRVAGKQCRI